MSDFAEQVIVCEGLASGMYRLANEVLDLEQQVKELTEANEKSMADYNELIFAVANKWPNELRHQTALRYIIERESSNNPEGQED